MDSSQIQADLLVRIQKALPEVIWIANLGTTMVEGEFFTDDARVTVDSYTRLVEIYRDITTYNTFFDTPQIKEAEQALKPVLEGAPLLLVDLIEK